MDELSFLHKEDPPLYAGGPSQSLVPRDPFDVAPIGDLFGRYQAQIDAMQDEASEVVVTDQTSHDRALTMIGEAKQIARRIEIKRKEVKAPYLDACKAIDGFANPLVGRLKMIADGLQSTLSTYLIAQERRRREAEAEARRAAEEARRKAEAEAQEKARQAAADAAEQGIEAPPPEPVVMPAMPAVPTETRSQVDTATASVDIEWSWSIDDLAKVLQNTALLEARTEPIVKAITPWINAQVRAGARSIPGVHIYQTEKVKTRVRR